MTRSVRPEPDLSNGWLAVYDGRICIGFLISRGRAGIEALDRDERSIGLFATTQAAARAISAHWVAS